MVMSSSKIPPPNALMAFEAAARNESFTEAARELEVTRVAISRQVSLLEKFVGTDLFSRKQSSVRLTEAGRRLSRTVSVSFQTIMDEVDAIQSSGEDRLITIATTAGVSTYWLMPRIGRYREIDPEADFRLLVSHELINLVQSNVDIAIRYGDGDWAGVDATLLRRQSILPACSQLFLKKHGPFGSFEALAEVPLLDYESAVDPTSKWSNYFRDMGARYDASPRMSSYQSYINFVQAVLDGQGVGLVGPPLMQQFFDSGVLVPALDVVPLEQRGYYLCIPTGVSPSDTVKQFSGWLQHELSEHAG